jgi:RHS repeat-associated protein
MRYPTSLDESGPKQRAANKAKATRDTYMKRHQLALAAAAILLLTGHLLGQTQHINRERGFNANRVYDSFDLDSINTFNGNLIINIPLGQPYRVGGGLSYSFNLIYNSFIWSQEEVCSAGPDQGISFSQHLTALITLQRRAMGSHCIPVTDNDGNLEHFCGGDEYTTISETPLLYDDESGPRVDLRSQDKYCQTINDINPASNAGVGWQLNFGKIFRPRTTVGVSNPHFTGRLYEVYESPDGSEHQFYPTLHEEDTDGAAGDSTNHFFTRDSTYIRMWRNPNPDSAYYRNAGNNYSYILEFPNGEKHYFQRLRMENGGADQYGHVLYLPYDEDKIVRIEDQFGNWVKFAYADDASDTDDNDGSGPNTEVLDNLMEISDSTGRTHTIEFVKANSFGPVLIKRVNLKALNGSTATYTFRYGETAAEIGQSGIPDKFRTPTLIAWPHPEKGFIDGYNTGTQDMAEKVTLPYLTSIELPYNMKYTMPLDTSYRPLNLAVSVLAPGAITGMTLPTGGRIEWDYEVTDTSDPTHSNTYGYYYSSASSGRRAARFSPGVRRRRLIEGPRTHVWKYDPSIGGQAAGCGPFDIHEPCGSHHLVNKVTTPTGDFTNYYYAIYPWPQGNALTRQVDQAHLADYGQPFTKDPGIARVIDTQNKPLFLSTEVFDLNNDGSTTLVRSTYVRYDMDKYVRSDGFSISEANARLVASRTVYNDDPANTYDEVQNSGFDGLGHYRRVERHSTVRSLGTPDISSQYIAFTKGGDYAVDPGTNLPTSGSYFNPIPLGSPWVTSIYTSIVKRDDLSNSKIAEDYYFEDTGLLRRKRIRNTISEAASHPAPTINDVVVTYDYNNGNPTIEKYYGGDKQTGINQRIGTQEDLAAVTLPANSEYTITHGYPTCSGGTLGVARSSEYAGAGFKTEDYDIDCSTGLVKVSRDTALNATTYAYDLLGRVTDISRQQGNSTHINYNDVTNGSRSASPSVNVFNRFSATNNTTLNEEEYRYDQLGRLTTEIKKLPGGKSFRDTVRNGVGWTTLVSEWHDGTTNAGRKTVYENFDAFGRPTKITLPDNKVINQFYSGIREVYRKVQVGTSISSAGLVGEESSEKWERYDSNGQLNQVEEQSGAGGARTTTTYRYSVLGKLAWTCTAGGGLSQCRSFRYNARGNLTAEVYPERSWAQYGDIDTMGNTGSSYDGVHWLSYTYDGAGRPTRVDELAGSWRPIKEFTYYGANGGTGGTFALGKLATSKRHNYVLNPYEFNQNYALASNGGTVVASSTNSTGYDAQYVIDGRRSGSQWGVNGGWNDGTSNAWPDWVEVRFNGSKSINAINVFTLQDNYQTPVEPTQQQTFSLYGLVDFQVQYWNGSSWATVPNGSVVGNNLVWKQVSFAPITTDRIRVYVTKALNSWSRITEIEAYGGNPTVYDVSVNEQYTYSGLDGRLNKRVSSTSIPDGPVFEQSYSYNQLGDLQWQTYPKCTNPNCAGSGAQRPWTVSYGYDSGLLTSVGGGPGEINTTGGTYATSITYNINQTVGAVTHRNGLVDRLEMDPNNMQRPKRICTYLPVAAQPECYNALWNTSDYKYDGAGNITRIGSDWYLYDKVGRLKEGTALFSPDPLKRLKQQYDYDIFGNKITTRTYNNVSLTSTGSLKDTYGTGVNSSTNKLNMNYDGAGNLLGSNGQAQLYTYDALNMIVTAPGLTYLYGPNEERFWIIDTKQNNLNADNEETFTLRGLNNEVLREYKVVGGNAVGNWYWNKDYVYRGSTLLAAETTNGIRHYHVDHLGSPRLITDGNISDADGAVREQMQFLPFGENSGFYQNNEFWSLSSSSEPVSTRLRFAGHEKDSDVIGLDYMHARHFWERGSRFMTMDPGRDIDLAQPQSWNPYSYVRNNPLGNIDADGRFLSPSTFWSTVAAIASMPRGVGDPFLNNTMRRIFKGVDEQSVIAQVNKWLDIGGVQQAMKMAWEDVNSGTSTKEAGFRLDVQTDPMTGQEYTITDYFAPQMDGGLDIPLNENTVLTGHTHTNDSSGYPSTPGNNYMGSKDYGDTLMAEKSGVPIVIIHRTGLRLYDPVLRKTLLIRKGLSWLK